MATTGTGSVNFQFRISQVPGSFNLRTRTNVKKHIANIIYIKEPPNDAIKLEYVGSKESLPSVNLFIADRSDDVYNNTRNTTLQEFIGDKLATSVVVANKNFLVTQEFIDSDADSIPLYYRHELPSTVSLESIKVFDKDFNPIDPASYKITSEYIYNEDTGIRTDVLDKFYLFNSLESFHDPKTGDYNVYFVQYTNSSETITELLDNEAAYTEAAFSDFWHLTPGFLKPWARAYVLRDDDFFSDNYFISLPASSKYAVKYIESQRVRVAPPVDISDEGPWFPRVINGGFLHGINGRISKYDIREFSNQSFNPIEPYKLSGRTKCLKINDNLIKFPHETLSFNSAYSNIDITLEDDGVVKYAITSNHTKAGDEVYDLDGRAVPNEDNTANVTWSYSKFLGVDRRSGIVLVDQKILDSYEIYATYTYKEKYFSVTDLVMNPIFDLNATNEKRIIFLVPRNEKNTNSTTQTASIGTLRVGKNGKIIYSNQDGRDYNPKLDFDTRVSSSNGYSLSGVLGLHYSWFSTTTSSEAFDFSSGTTLSVVSTNGFPKSGWLRTLDTSSNYRYFKYTSKTDIAFVLSETAEHHPLTGTIPSSSQIELVNFIDEFAIQSRRNAQEEIDYYGETTGYPSFYSQYLILGELSINPPHGVHDLTRIDVRQNGGGIREELYDEAKALNPEIQWLNDYGTFNGQVYPGSSVLVVKLPISLKEDFSLDRIREIVKEHVPMGVYPLIRFYGYEPRIISCTPEAESITIDWEKEGSEFVYDILYATNADAEYHKANLVRITDGAGTYNTFTITDLTANQPYFVKIDMRDKYYQWWYGYSSYNSIEGGLGLSENAPTAPFGNVVNFQYRIL
jgi:hypothetical protein